jgi:isochorismate synthase
MEKVVLAREVHAAAHQPFSIAAAVRHLGAAYPDCYVFNIWRGEHAFVGATPERLVRLDGRDVRTSSLAGSSPRGATPDEDRALAERLLASEKDRIEHAVVRRTLCAALAEVGDEVTAAEEPSVLTLPQVHHLHTAVHARLRAGHSLLEIVERLHPTPAVGGHPREAALRFIGAHEQMDRGWYAAPVGWLGRDHGEFAVALRSALIAGAEATLFAGCGVVADSDPDQEYAESVLKLRPMESALAAAAEGAR